MNGKIYFFVYEVSKNFCLHEPYDRNNSIWVDVNARLKKTSVHNVQKSNLI
jgi:hypothetical protein